MATYLTSYILLRSLFINRITIK